MKIGRTAWGCVLVAGALVACGGAAQPSNEAPGGPADASTTDTSVADASPASDGSTTPAADGGEEAAAPPAQRNATCTPLSQQTGTLVDTGYGRMDGTLVYVLPVGGSQDCNGDSSHLHLQIEVKGLIYDVAVDVGSTGDDVGIFQQSVTVPGGVWSEGWHGADMLSYPSVGVTSSELPIDSDPSDVATKVSAMLTSVSKISIFCTGYNQENGCHDVHYQHGTGDDGAIVLDPTSATSPVLFFRFQSQSF